MARAHPEVPEIIQDECPICFSELTPEKYPSVIDGCCDHKFCRECLENWVKKSWKQVWKYFFL